MPSPDRESDVVALVVAAGRGLRSGQPVPKQYAQLAGTTVLRRTLQALSATGRFSRIAVVIHPDDRLVYEEAASGLPGMTPPVEGGPTRQDSVRLGLEALASDPPGLVFIHDAARPLVSAALVARILNAAGPSHGVVPALPVSETLKRVHSNTIAEDVAREGIWAVQTPQAFPFGAILEAHREAQAFGRSNLTDDAAVADLAGLPTHVVAGDRLNIKLTTPADFRMAELLLERLMETRIGHGYDVHAFAVGSAVTLCGISISHEAKLHGHSDADVGLHALTDAVLGAVAEGDIGDHFPPSDPRWKDAPSAQFLAFAVERVRSRGARLVNLDLTIVCEAPKIAPHRAAMRQRVAEIAGLCTDRVSVKATTSERLGFTGRREGIAAFATATVQVPAGEPPEVPA
ncbi:bifunctional 2-C-methyl-D-erythritol 4-phosphate cytidylyltransferase/2-C-methyl-D-erythritol 2,4-cyclodiphosphate synthase [Propylenella binzhouense]|uniref:Bifunctional enzyme IspD/IspF n=1 Tax=Propylenella binzhouense TaxID=2555902 RepID=A0A964T2L5_9HYPH|nr:bifunctional 2-C-methyl-D-erythritol 4-phosphate cytidylyltransferase/2-C-methyl-D-erythritol 2,4-cyclodiphosphate synthase [Propylenella binzhouense]MYZ47220.1 bifunctional 2-C-methyl-D-erythritol 4-phosphate cytidylyltransferase/2-C-methyl-D-erythritol 2,4-cyclodiphosphate synthase [Propylenella binzhouense]